MWTSKRYIVGNGPEDSFGINIMHDKDLKLFSNTRKQSVVLKIIVIIFDYTRGNYWELCNETQRNGIWAPKYFRYYFALLHHECSIATTCHLFVPQYASDGKAK